MRSGKINEYESGKAWLVQLFFGNKCIDHYLLRTKEKAEESMLAWVQYGAR